MQNLRSGALEWGCVIAQEQPRDEYPKTVIQGNGLYLQCDQPDAANGRNAPPCMQQRHRPSRTAAQPCPCETRVAFANVGTARSDGDITDDHIPFLPRAIALREKTQGLGYLIVGVAEARTLQKAYKCTGYHVISSGATTDTQLGLELWVSTTIPYATHRKRQFRLQQKHCMVRHASPRTLVVTIAAPLLTITVVVAHAPTHGATVAARRLWWEEFTQLLCIYPLIS